MLPLTHVHLLTFNSAPTVVKAAEAVLSQQGFELGGNLILELTDNASTNGVVECVEKAFQRSFPVLRNSENLGFCGAQNQAVHRFLESAAQYLLILNPDAKLERQSLSLLVSALEGAPKFGMATPLLMRGTAELEPLDPVVVDAAGMRMTKELRHLDRGSGALFDGSLAEGGAVFGGSGACLLLRRECVEDLLLDGGRREVDVDRLYPQLAKGRGERALLFDEGFFAYREDADLAWRAQLMGWGTLYVPEARVVHERRVLPERRAALPAELNRLSVRNRFLLQSNNLTWGVVQETFLRGVLLRNLLVFLGVLVRERSSLSAFRDIVTLSGRSWARRRALRERITRRGPAPSIAHWFAGHELSKVRDV
jgi:GT2 family glycosyltransferase